MKQGDGIFIFMLRQNHFNGQIWGVDEEEKAWSQEAIVACDAEGIYLDSSSGEEGNLELKVISEVKLYRKF